MVDQAKKQQAARLISRGIAAVKARDPQRARQFLLEARKLDPENTDALLWLTSTTRDPDQRRQILQQVLRIDPNHAQALRALAKLEGSPLPPKAPPPTASEAPQAAAGEPVEAAEEVPPPEVEATLEVGETGEVTDAFEPEREPEAPAEPSSLLARLESEAEEPPEAAEPLVEEAPINEMPELDETPLPELEPEPEAESEEVSEAVAVEPGLEEVAPEPEAISAPVQEEPPAAEAPTPEPVPEPIAAAPAPPADLRPPSVQEMISQVEATRCPRCGAVMRQREGTDQLYCVFCGYGMEGEAEAEVGAEISVVTPEQAWPEAQRARHCLNCGTHSIPPSGQEHTPCPLCQQSIFEPSEPLAIQPDVWLPFKLNEAEAAIAIEDEVRGGLRRLLGGKVEMTRPRRVLLPVWVFNARARVDPGQGIETFTEAYHLVPVHTLPQMDSQLLRVASAVPFEDVQPYREEAIRGAFVLLPSQPFQACAREIRMLIERDAREKAQAHLRQTGTLRRTGPLGARPVEILDLGQRLVLLPVWINEIREGGRLRAGMVNAYTGTVIVGNMVHRQHGR